MKILHCLFTRGFAGTERHVAELAGWQARRHAVTLVVAADCRDPATGGDIRDHLDPAVDLVVLPPGLLTLGLLRTLWRVRPDIVHPHLGRACHRAVRLPRPPAPLVTTIHKRFKPSLHGRFDGVVCIAGWQRADIPAGHRGAVAVIGNWTRPRPAPDPARRERLRAALGVAPGQFLIGAAGRLIPEKGFDVLLEAFGRAGLPDTRLVLFGAGPQEAALRRLAPPGVRFAGYRPDLPSELAALDAFVLPSRHEPFGLVLLEAMAAGLPVAATRSGGPIDILGDDHPLLAPPGDPAALAETLRRLTAARPFAYDPARFSLEGQAAQLEAFYGNVIAQTEAQNGLPHRPAAGQGIGHPDAHRLSVQPRADAPDRP